MARRAQPLNPTVLVGVVFKERKLRHEVEAVRSSNTFEDASLFCDLRTKRTEGNAGFFPWTHGEQ